MPQLVCPNDSAAMQSVTRSGVGFDFCPTCRGVWLDRGELDKLMEASQGGEAEVGPVPPQPSERPWRGQEPRLDSRYRRYHDRDHD